jgi:hypothetical protein
VDAVSWGILIGGYPADRAIAIHSDAADQVDRACHFHPTIGSDTIGTATTKPIKQFPIGHHQK